MKKNFFLVFAVIMFINSAIFSFVVEYKHPDSAVNVSSFGVFSTDFDTFVKPMYYSDTRTSEHVTAYTGISQNFYNAGVSGMYNDFYGSLIFWEKVANYSAWPHNHTNLGLSFTVARNNWAVQTRYLDFCYGKGRAYIDPGVTVAKIFETDSSYKLRISLAHDFFVRYWKSAKEDAFMPKTSIAIDYSEDSSRGFGLEYNYVAYLTGSNNKTDVSNCPDTHRFYAWGGLAYDLDENITVGFRPSFLFVLNGANPVKSTYNCYSEYWNNEFHALLPLSVKYAFNSKIDLFVSVLFGQYYASFDHLGYTGTGGSNFHGWVTENGLGMGINARLSPKCTVQIGSQFTAIQENDSDPENPTYKAAFYKSENVSASNIGEAPISAIIQLYF